jgi:ABC-type Fe3+/spermidine/putrescine transport system ATPase subunit
VRKPSVFLFDEPLSNLDAKLRVKMRGELAAASVMATFPLVFLVLLFQRRIVRGLSAGSIVQ